MMIIQIIVWLVIFCYSIEPYVEHKDLEEIIDEFIIRS